MRWWWVVGPLVAFPVDGMVSVRKWSDTCVERTELLRMKVLVYGNICCFLKPVCFFAAPAALDISEVLPAELSSRNR